jgi:hypothetical protein
MAGPTATGYLELDLSGFNRAIDSAKKALTVLVGAFAAMKVAGFLKDGIEEAINFGNEMYHAGKAIGNIDPGALLIAQKALEASGLSASAARSEIDGLVESGRPLKSLYQNSAQFAKAMTEAKSNYGSQAAVLSSSAEHLSRIFEYIQSIGSKIKTFFLSMTAQFTEPLEAVMMFINRLDLADIGAKFGQKISDAVTVLTGLFKGGDLGEAAGLALAVAFDFAAQKLSEGLAWLFDERGADFAQKIIDYMWGLKDVFLAIAEVFVQKIQQGVAKVSDSIGLTKVAAFYRASAEGLGFMAKENLTTAISGGSAGTNFAAGFSKDGKEASDKLAKVLDKGMLTGKGVITDAAGDRDKAKINYQALGKQDPFAVISSSMAKIGGGGNYIQTGMSAEARQLIKNGRAAEKTNEILTAGFIGLSKPNTLTSQ